MQYNKYKNAKKFISGTISVDFGIVQNRFLDKLHPGAEILDYGCGSGRDTKYFLEQGCKVTAIDGSQKLCKLASTESFTHPSSTGHSKGNETADILRI